MKIQHVWKLGKHKQTAEKFQFHEKKNSNIFSREIEILVYIIIIKHYQKKIQKQGIFCRGFLKRKKNFDFVV